MSLRVAVLRCVIGIGMVLALDLATSSPAFASQISASAKPPASHAAANADPLVGPLTRLEASHLGDAVHLTPMAANTQSQQLQRGLAQPWSFATSPLATNISYNRSGLQKEVFGFAPYWALKDESTWNYNVMSTVAYFGLDVMWDGTWNQNTSGWRGYFSAELVDMIARAHAAGDKAVLVIKSGGTAALNDVVTNPAETQLVIANTIGAMANRGFDGVNIDFEGTGPSSIYPNIQTGMTSFAAQMSAAVHAQWPSAFVSIDTYTGSASWSGGLYKIDDLSPVVDALFIMAYDMSFSNMGGHAGPNAPMTGWTYNDTQSIAEYLTKAPASKIILGVPWYGYRFTTNSSAPYAATSNAAAEPYSKNMTTLACAHPATRWDSTAQSYWSVWFSPASGDSCGINGNSWQELYFEDTQSLGIKYQFVNTSGIRGMGIWALGYDGGAPELWGELSTYFSCPTTITVSPTQSTTTFSAVLSAGTCSVYNYDLQIYDPAVNTGGIPQAPVRPTSASSTVTFDGLAGHTYQIWARAHSLVGIVSPWVNMSTTVNANATQSHPFAGLYVLDAFGGVNGEGSPHLTVSAYWPGLRLARSVRALPGTVPQSGAVMDSYGGLHSYGAPITLTTSAYWSGWDIARDFAFLPSGTGGYTLDAYGDLHPFSVNGGAMPPAASTGAYWAGWDIARKVVIFSDGTGGYVLDGFGGLHPFGIGQAGPGAVQTSGYWGGWDIAHDIALIPGTHSGYVVDGFGDIHPFTPTGQAMPPVLAPSAYWGGWDIARSVWLLPGSTLIAPGGYVLDGYGGLHQFGNAPAPPAGPYWGRDYARNLTGY